MSPHPRRSRSAARLGGVVALAVVAALGLVACGASSDSASGGDVVALPTPERAAPEAGEQGADGGAVAEDSSGSSTLAGVEQGRSLIVTAATTVRAEDVSAATAAALDIARRYDALVVAQQTTADERGDDVAVDATSTLVLRVQPADVDAVLGDLGKLGSVVTVTRSVSDVTAEVADVDARVKNAEASLARIRTLLARAEDIGDVVALEAELSRRQADLEALQARQRALADQTALATVTVSLIGPRVVVVDPDEDLGFLAGLRRGWEAFVDAVTVGLTALGVLLPFLAVLLVVLIPLAWWLRRQHRRSRPTPPAPGQAPAGSAAPAQEDAAVRS